MKRKQFAVIVFIALIGGIIGGILSNQMLSKNFAFAQDEKPFKVLKAEKFELIDTKGRNRAYLSYVDDMAVLGMGDGLHSNYLLIVQKPDSVSLSLHSSGGNSVEIQSQPDLTSIIFYDKKITQMRLAFGLDAKGDPSIRLYDDNENSRITIGNTQLTDSWTGSTIIRPEGSIIIFNKEGELTYQLP